MRFLSCDWGLGFVRKGFMSVQKVMRIIMGPDLQRPVSLY